MQTFQAFYRASNEKIRCAIIDDLSQIIIPQGHWGKWINLFPNDPRNVFKPMDGWLFSEDGEVVVIEEKIDIQSFRLENNDIYIVDDDYHGDYPKHISKYIYKSKAKIFISEGEYLCDDLISFIKQTRKIINPKYVELEEFILLNRISDKGNFHSFSYHSLGEARYKQLLDLIEQ